MNQTFTANQVLEMFQCAGVERPRDLQRASEEIVAMAKSWDVCVQEAALAFLAQEVEENRISECDAESLSTLMLDDY